MLLFTVLQLLFFLCHFICISTNRQLLLGKTIVQTASVVAMCVFPVMFSHVPQDCMHLSPYVLLFLFSGEVSACVYSVLSHVIIYREHCRLSLCTLYVNFVNVRQEVLPDLQRTSAASACSW